MLEVIPLTLIKLMMMHLRIIIEFTGFKEMARLPLNPLPKTHPMLGEFSVHADHADQVIRKAHQMRLN
jgi:hypothetical protein